MILKAHKIDEGWSIRMFSKLDYFDVKQSNIFP